MDPLVSHVTVNAGRIVFPQHLSDRLSWLTGNGPVSAWAFLICPGRIRILSDEDVMHDPILEPLRTLMLNGPDPPPRSEPTTAQDLPRAALVARLVPVSISLITTGWRLGVPRTFEAYLPSEYNGRALSIVFSLEGYIEIWHTQLLCAALSGEQHLLQQQDKK